MPPPIQNFEGINNLCGCYPPDTEGDVGPNHYMQWVNLHYAIYSKTGTLLVGPNPGNTLFPGTPNCATLNRGDPIVLYDQFADRWMANQFAFVSTGAGRSTSASRSRTPTIRRAPGARTSSSSTRSSSTTTRSSASGRLRTRTR